VALRDEAWLTASDSACSGRRPFDAEASEESAPVVLVVDETVGVAADLLGEHVHVLNAAVRGSAGSVVGEDLASPAVDGAGQSGEFGDFGVRAVLEEHDQAAAGVADVDGSANPHVDT
jgi:hypothetical protein